MEGLSRKEKGLMDTDNSVAIAGGEEGVRGLNGNGKNTIKIFFFFFKERRVGLTEAIRCEEAESAQ